MYSFRSTFRNSAALDDKPRGGSLICRSRSARPGPPRSRHAVQNTTTHFLTEPDALDILQVAILDRPARRVCLFSDGLERLVLNFRDRSAHAPFFDNIFRPIEQHTEAGYAAQVSRELETLLASEKINSRTDDDKSLLCAALLAGVWAA